jgi:hypothetical protein
MPQGFQKTMGKAMVKRVALEVPRLFLFFLRVVLV